MVAGAERPGGAGGGHEGAQPQAGVGVTEVFEDGAQRLPGAEAVPEVVPEPICSEMLLLELRRLVPLKLVEAEMRLISDSRDWNS